MAERRQKPYAEYPLFWHQQGYWAKKFKGKLHYFGTRGGSWQKALKEFNLQVHAFQLGQSPRVIGVTVADLCDEFLGTKARLVESGEFAPPNHSGTTSGIAKSLSATWVLLVMLND